MQGVHPREVTIRLDRDPAKKTIFVMDCRSNPEAMMTDFNQRCLEYLTLFRPIHLSCGCCYQRAVEIAFVSLTAYQSV